MSAFTHSFNKPLTFYYMSAICNTAEDQKGGDTCTPGVSILGGVEDRMSELWQACEEVSASAGPGLGLRTSS